MEEKVKESLASPQTLLGDTLGFKASKLPSGAAEKEGKKKREEREGGKGES